MGGRGGEEETMGRNFWWGGSKFWYWNTNIDFSHQNLDKQRNISQQPYFKSFKIRGNRQTFSWKNFEFRKEVKKSTQVWWGEGGGGWSWDPTTLPLDLHSYPWDTRILCPRWSRPPTSCFNCYRNGISLRLTKNNKLEKASKWNTPFYLTNLNDTKVTAKRRTANELQRNSGHSCE